MTVTTTLDRQYFPGDGANKNFPFNFKFFDNSQIYVFLIDPLGNSVGKILNVDYTLSGALSPSGGMVVMTVAPPLNYRLFVQRILSPTQPTSIRNQSAFFPAIHEDVFDRLTMLVQQSQANDESSIQLDQSGELWDFKGHRGINAADPVNPQDVVTKQWAANYIDSVSGVANTTTGIAYDGGTLFDYLRFGVGRTVDSIAALKALSGGRNQRAFVLGYYQIGDGGGGEYYVDPTDTTTPDDLGTVIVGLDGSRWKLVNDANVSVLQFGAVPGLSTLANAQRNTQAFRNATLTYKAAWNLYKTGLKSRSVVVPAGDFNLSNGFCIPPGCCIYGHGIGVTRLKILGATADVTNVIPLCLLGRVLNDATLVSESTTGAYVTNPPPEIRDLFLNPQNSNTAIGVYGMPGFKIGNLWIQALVAIDIDQGSGDGIIGQIVVEDSSSIALRLGNCQNIVFDALYTFSCVSPVVISGPCNNIDIGLVQANYSTTSVVSTLDGTTSGRVSIGKLVCNQNVQYGTFTSVVRTRSSGCDIRIGDLDARNYNGFAVNNETGLGNVVSIGHAKLRQTPNNPAYAIGTTAKGFRVNNSRLTVQHLDSDGISDSPFLYDSTVDPTSFLRVYSAKIGTHVAVTPVLAITGTQGTISLAGVENNSTKALFNSAAVKVAFKNCTTPFPVVSEGGRLAIKIPFSGNVNSWSMTVSANTNPSGNAGYRRSRKFWLTQETSFSSVLSTGVFSASLGNSGFGTAFSPDIASQLDINTVAAGATLPYVSTGSLVISFPSTYTAISYTIELE